jgi:hypothetical protein
MGNTLHHLHFHDHRQARVNTPPIITGARADRRLAWPLPSTDPEAGGRPIPGAIVLNEVGATLPNARSVPLTDSAATTDAVALIEPVVP